jgi:hypothetical protein
MYFTKLNVKRLTVIVCLVLCSLIILSLQDRVLQFARTKAASAATIAQGDPSVVGQWSTPMSWNNTVAIHSHVLPNGKVLTWQRRDSDLTTMTYLWDPATGTFSQIFNPNTHLFCSGHSFLADGKLLVSGGHHFSDGNGEPHTNIFDFNTNTWTRVADMNAGRWYPTNTTLANGEVLTISGLYWNGSQLVTNQIPQVWQANGTWRPLGAPLSGEVLPLYPWMLLAPDGRVFNSGPQKTSRFLNTSGSGTWSDGPNSALGTDPQAEVRNYGSSVMYDAGKVLNIGGGDPPTSNTETIDLNLPTPTWQSAGSMTYARRQINATVLPDGKVLVTGGTSGSGFNNPVGSVYPAEMWDPATRTWSVMASMQVPRLYHSTAVLLPDGRVLSAGGGLGGSDQGATDHPDAEIYSPPYLFKGARPTITSAPTSVTYGQSFFVQTPDAGSITKVTLVRLSSVTHSFNENQRLIYLSKSVGAGRLDLTAPTNRNVCPPGHYMLFILNGNGVPSIAKIIAVQETSAYEGYVDGSDCNQIWGWAWDKNLPNTPINVDIYDGSSLIATVPANLFRQDLLNAGKGNGYHAFVYNLPLSVKNGLLHSISVKFAGTNTNLSLSPRSVVSNAMLFPSFSGTVTSVSGGGQTWEQAIDFSSSVSGKITHIRFYKASGETGTHIGRIWSNTGTLLAQASFPSPEAASGWHEVTLVTPLQITAGVRYRVSYNVNTFGAKIVSGLSSPISNGPLTAWGGYYTTPSGTFPNTGSVSNFLADIRFCAP